MCGCVFVYHTVDYMLVLELSCILTNLTKRNVCVCVGYGLAMYVLKDMQDLDCVYTASCPDNRLCKGAVYLWFYSVIFLVRLSDK